MLKTQAFSLRQKICKIDKNKRFILLRNNRQHQEEKNTKFMLKQTATKGLIVFNSSSSYKNFTCSLFLTISSLIFIISFSESIDSFKNNNVKKFLKTVLSYSFLKIAMFIKNTTLNIETTNSLTRTNLKMARVKTYNTNLS